MAASTSDFVSVLNDLIEVCKDGERGFREAAEGVKNHELRTIFEKYSRQRAEFAAELQVEVSRIGGSPEKSGSAAGALHRGWINLKAAVTGKNDHAILEEAERGEDGAVSGYRDALSKDLPSDFVAIIRKQYDAIQVAHREIRGLRDSVPA
jgi:uncharacterized protein (TIGR02284 family)